MDLTTPISIILVIATYSASAVNNPRVLVNINEERPVGTWIVTLSNFRTLDENLRPEKSSFLTYRLLEDMGTTRLKVAQLDLISVEMSHGNVTVKNRIDREAICPENPDKCIMVYSILVTPVYYSIITLEIEIFDINDNHPMFPVPVLSLSMLEYVSFNTRFRLPLATDKDTEAFGVKSYAISSIFGLDGSSRVAEKFVVTQVHKHLELIVRDSLNLSGDPTLNPYQTYSFRVVAFDKGSPPLEGMLEVRILGRNDHSPAFSKNFYESSLPEDAEVGIVVLAVSATDFDMGVSGKVFHELLEIRNNLPFPSADFAIDEDTGQISLKSSLDREIKSRYELLVEARNDGKPRRTATAVVSVTVEDVNDEKPDISFIYLVEEGLWENSEPPIPVAFLKVIDSDSNSNGYVECQLTEGSESFAIQRNAIIPGNSRTLSFNNKLLFFLSSTAMLDSESARFINVAVVCRDNPVDGKSLVSSVVIPVKVLDVNDNTPMFSGSYEMSISENVDAGTIIGRVSASDADDGQNGHVTYKLLNDSIDCFIVDASTGEIQSRVEFDREAIVPSFKLKVVAADGGSPPKSSTATVYVEVLDVNDNLPAFSHPEYTFLVPDLSKPNTMVGNIDASDADVGDNAVIKFRIVKDPRECSEISIDSKTGRLYANLLLDAKRCKVHSFYVEGTNPNLEKGSFVPVTVFVREPTDAEPVFVFPGGPEYDSVLQKYPVYVGQEITKLSVLGDMPVIYTLLGTVRVSGRLSEILIPERPECLANTFSLNSENGSLIVNLKCLDDLKLMKNTTFELKVRAANAKIPMLSSESTLKLSFAYLPNQRHDSPVTSLSLNYSIIITIIVSLTLELSLFIIIFLVLRSRKHKGKDSERKSAPLRTRWTSDRKDIQSPIRTQQSKRGSKPANESLKSQAIASLKDFSHPEAQCPRNFLKSVLDEEESKKNNTILSPLDQQSSESSADDGKARVSPQDSTDRDKLSRPQAPFCCPSRILTKNYLPKYAVKLKSSRDGQETSPSLYVVLTPKYLTRDDVLVYSGETGHSQHCRGTGSFEGNSSMAGFTVV